MRAANIELGYAMLRPTYAEVELSAITDNIRAIRSRVGDGVKIMPAVKADGYGHGAFRVSLACLEGSADVLCVACAEEGIELREAGVEAPILILSCMPAGAAEDIVAFDLTSTACDMDFARALSQAAVKQNRTALVHIKVDTGMGRIGVAGGELTAFALAIAALPGLRIEGLFTHFPSSDESDRSYTTAQIEAFREIVESLRSAGVAVPVVHASNSGGILAYPDADFDGVRPGIMVYGCYPSTEVVRSIPIREALTLKTRIAFLKESDAGATVSYNRTHTLTRRSKVATLPIGYADGYFRALSNQGEAAVRGMRVPVIGRVCMDQIMIDVTDVPNVALGDEVVLYGGGYDYLSVPAIADKIGTISYELFCAIGKRVPRVYI